MRYILTFDGRTIAYDENADDLDKPTIRNSKDNVVRESGSIEGLLDCVVLISAVRRPRIVHEGKIDEGVKFENLYLDCTEKLLGATWLPKGLIYVAVLNDDGKFELL